jgi:hypothetical protein
MESSSNCYGIPGMSIDPSPIVSKLTYEMAMIGTNVYIIRSSCSVHESI